MTGAELSPERYAKALEVVEKGRRLSIATHHLWPYVGRPAEEVLPALDVFDAALAAFDEVVDHG